jgi:hypothetical protein
MNVVLTVTGIALPSLLVVVALRRWIVDVPWRIVLLFLAMTYVFLHGAVFTSKLPVPVDEIAVGYPFRGVFGEVKPRNSLTNDTVKLFLPWMQVAREQLFRFQLPLWNPYSFSGYPLLGNGESAPFSPLFLATLFVPLPKQIVAMAGLKIFLALLFGYLFAKRFWISDAASCFAATAFAWSVFQTVFLYYSTTAVTALLPATLFAFFYALDVGGRRSVVLVAIVVGSLLANGHPESVLHIAIASAGLLLIELALRRDWRRFLIPVWGSLLGLALSAPTWIPVLEQVLLSTRLAELRRIGGHPAMYPLTAVWAMVSPNGFGNPVRQNWSWFLNYSLVAASYVGLVVLALVATALVSRWTPLGERLWTVWAVVLWLIALGWTPIGAALNRVPPFTITANDKLRFAALFIAAVVSATCLDRLRERRSWLLPLFAVPLCALSLYVYRAKTALLRPADLASVVAVVIVVLVALTVPRRVGLTAFLALAVELFLLNHGFNALVDAKYDRPELPIIRALKQIAPNEPYRIAGFDWMLIPNMSAQYGLEDIRGSDPMSFAAYTELLKPIVVDDPSIDLDRVINVEPALLDELNVRYLLAAPGAAFGGRWRQVYSGADGTLFENQAWRSRFYVAEGEGTVRVSEVSPTRFRIEVNALTPTTIRSSQLARGWRVSVDEKGLADAADRVFIHFAVPPGRHIVEVAYRPLAFYGSLLLALAAGLLLAFRKSWNSTYPRGVVRGPNAESVP